MPLGSVLGKVKFFDLEVKFIAAFDFVLKWSVLKSPQTDGRKFADF